MDYQQLIANMTPETFRSLRRAVELGKWPDGRSLTREQRETCLQAVIAWGERNLPPERRVGHIDKGHKSGDTCDDPLTKPLNWRD